MRMTEVYKGWFLWKIVKCYITMRFQLYIHKYII